MSVFPVPVDMVLLIASRLIHYPGNDFDRDLEWMMNELENETQGETKEAWTSIVQLFQSMPLEELKKIYVETFDWKEKTGLYLTAQELGDSRKRGAALIKLQKLINEAGFDRLDGELADYIPMLYEFLAVAQENPAVERLKRRLAAATFRISENIEEKNPYALVFKRLMTDVFLAPSVEELENLKKERETADLEELPYPLMYDA